MGLKEASIKTIMIIASFAAGIIITIAAWSFAAGGWRTSVESNIKQLRQDVTHLQAEQARQREYEIASAKQLARIEQQICDMRQDVTEIKQRLQHKDSAWAIKKSLTEKKGQDNQ
jgi:hypothetical protein